MGLEVRGGLIYPINVDSIRIQRTLSLSRVRHLGKAFAALSRKEVSALQAPTGPLKSSD